MSTFVKLSSQINPTMNNSTTSGEEPPSNQQNQSTLPQNTIPLTSDTQKTDEPIQNQEENSTAPSKAILLTSEKEKNDELISNQQKDSTPPPEIIELTSDTEKTDETTQNEDEKLTSPSKAESSTSDTEKTDEPTKNQEKESTPPPEDVTSTSGPEQAEEGIKVSIPIEVYNEYLHSSGRKVVTPQLSSSSSSSGGTADDEFSVNDSSNRIPVVPRFPLGPIPVKITILTEGGSTDAPSEIPINPPQNLPPEGDVEIDLSSSAASIASFENAIMESNPNTPDTDLYSDNDQMDDHLDILEWSASEEDIADDLSYVFSNDDDSSIGTDDSYTDGEMENTAENSTQNAPANTGEDATENGGENTSEDEAENAVENPVDNAAENGAEDAAGSDSENVAECAAKNAHSDENDNIEKGSKDEKETEKDKKAEKEEPKQKVETANGDNIEEPKETGEAVDVPKIATSEDATGKTENNSENTTEETEKDISTELEVPRVAENNNNADEPEIIDLDTYCEEPESSKDKNTDEPEIIDLDVDCVEPESLKDEENLAIEEVLEHILMDTEETGAAPAIEAVDEPQATESNPVESGTNADIVVIEELFADMTKTEDNTNQQENQEENMEVEQSTENVDVNESTAKEEKKDSAKDEEVEKVVTTERATGTDDVDESVVQTVNKAVGEDIKGYNTEGGPTQESGTSGVKEPGDLQMSIQGPRGTKRNAATQTTPELPTKYMRISTEDGSDDLRMEVSTANVGASTVQDNEENVFAAPSTVQPGNATIQRRPLINRLRRTSILETTERRNLRNRNRRGKN